MIDPVAQRLTDMRDLVSRINGFVYMGSRTDAIIDTINALRKDPKLAARLLAEHPTESIPKVDASRKQCVNTPTHQEHFWLEADTDKYFYCEGT